MIPGEILPADGSLTLNEDRQTLTLTVANTGDRPVQSAPTTISSKSTRRSTSTATPRADTVSTSRPAPPCASSRGRAGK